MQKSTKYTIQQVFSKVSKELYYYKDLKKDTLLASLVKKDIVFKALTCLIITRNLLYNYIKQLELYSLLIIYNLVINPILINSYTTIPFSIKQSYKEYKVMLEVKTKIRDLEY